MTRIHRTIFSVIAMFFATVACAELKIEITEGVEGGVPIVVMPLIGEPAPKPSARNYSQIIASDLAYSGLFHILAPQEFTDLMPLGETTDYPAWFLRGAEKIVSGKIEANGTLSLRLDDIIQQRRLSKWRLQTKGHKIKSVAHYASDLIYEELTGIAGIFSTRLAFVSSDKLGPKTRRFHLNIADADGQHASTIYSSDKALVAPTWSPDYKRIAYTSYENKMPQIFVQVLTTGRRTNLSERIGPAHSPAWSKDGESLSFVVSDNDNSDIYIYTFANQKTVRVTQNLAIDTEPAWLSDDTLIFTSDRSGTPQLYSIVLATNEVTRLTFEGNYNADADVSPDRTKLTYISQRNGNFSVVIKDLSSDDEIALSFGLLDERPRFAPNGHLLGYLTQQDGRSAIGLLTTDGVFGKLIPVEANHIRGIAWSPLIRQ